MKPYYQRRIWNYLRRYGPKAPREVAAALSIPQESASKALQKLAADGCAIRTGKAAWCVSYAATERFPVDLRGLAPGSEAGRKFGTRLPHDPAYARYVLARKGNAHDRRPDRAAAGKIALEMAWPRG